MKRIILNSMACVLTIAISTVVLADWQPDDRYKMHYPQLPDPAGWDVYATYPFLVLADDWGCTETGWVKDIHFWGSWALDREGVVDSFALSIHANIPADPDTPWSRPGQTLWGWTTSDYIVIQFSSPGQGLYNPWTGDWVYPDHMMYYQYNIFLPEDRWFWQEDGTIYWLDISAYVSPPGYSWGWKSSVDHWNDDACWAFWGELNWIDIWEPPDFTESLDLAFVITGEPAECPCGDCNGDGRITVADAIYIVSYIYRGGPGMVCDCDVNLDGRLTVADAIYIVSYIYRGGPPPCEPTR